MYAKMYTKDEIVKALNGLEITWIGQTGAEIPAVIICPKGDQFSIKPLISPVDTCILLTMSVEGEVRNDLLQYFKRPDSCLSKGSNINGSCYVTELINSRRFTPGGTTGSPTCPFA